MEKSSGVGCLCIDPCSSCCLLSLGLPYWRGDGGPGFSTRDPPTQILPSALLTGLWEPQAVYRVHPTEMWASGDRRCDNPPGSQENVEASILDLHSGALSMGKKFVNIYGYYGEEMKEILTEEDFQLYRNVKRRIQQEIARTFDLDANSLYLTKPTFFSRMNSSEAKTAHDEYWHPHIDKVTYGSFDYTSLLYLSDYSRDFGGGRFIFIDEKTNSTLEPRLGRLSFFTSGSENLHRVEKVSWGTRYAITISFTCNPDYSIMDPTWL
ncbi:2-oxoglutarate and iron-dependent oxygenase domain-containing protein 3 isoform X2 [Eleutherodactylus coqui]|uniref:2-oxoglutarate and iron-dependent oxygenase domain-containing protein 3 isoform X2 n=1 Tax=Eleutherodactylus coqui TaxID=57060 RepID=UPI0034628F33